MWPSDARPWVTPVFLWIGSRGVATDYRVLGSLAHVRGLELLELMVPALGFPPRTSLLTVAVESGGVPARGTGGPEVGGGGGPGSGGAGAGDDGPPCQNTPGPARRPLQPAPRPCSPRAALAAPRTAPGGLLAAPAALLAAPCGPLAAPAAPRTAPCCCLPCFLRCPASTRPACCAAIASLRILAFDHEGRPIQFNTWLDDLQLYLLSDSRDSVSLFDHTSGATPAPPAIADSATRSQWLTRDAAARLAIRNHPPLAECAHFGQHRHLVDLVSQLRASDARYRAPAPVEFPDRNQPPMVITLYFIVTHLPDSLRAVRDNFLSLDPTVLTVDLLEQHLLAAETSVVTIGAARGTPRTPFFEGCSPSPLAPTYAFAAAVDVLGAEDVGAPSASAKCRNTSTCTRTGRHLATLTRRPGSRLYTLATEPPKVAASAQVSASCSVAPPCSCRLLSHQTLLWHHCLGHPSLPHLRGMHSHLLISGLPRSLPPLPPLPALPCLPCDEGRQHAAPNSSSFPPTTTPLQTLHMDVWGPACVSGQGLHLQLAKFCRGEGILQSFTLPESPQQNGIAERRIGLVMEVACTSMIHVAAPHFLWPFPDRYAAHQLNLWPRVSLPENSPTLRCTGEVFDASMFRVWGSRAFVRDTSADKLSARAIFCVYLGFPPDAPGWQFYHPTSRRVFPSQDVLFDESVPFYRLFPYRSAPPPPPPLFLAPGPLPVVIEFQHNPASEQHMTAVERTENETRITGGQVGFYHPPFEKCGLPGSSSQEGASGKTGGLMVGLTHYW
ncbi:unnamed protein product [Closterium sp. NIES-54]